MTNTQEALNYAAGIRSDLRGPATSGDLVNVRGSSPDYYLDGLHSPGFTNHSGRLSPYTLERIEVFRGPAALLYGQGSIAGFVNQLSKRLLPQAQREAAVQIGNFNLIKTLQIVRDIGPWRIAMNAQNLADKIYVADCSVFGSCFYGARRTVIGTVRYSCRRHSRGVYLLCRACLNAPRDTRVACIGNQDSNTAARDRGSKRRRPNCCRSATWAGN